jgi:hypothetical protein
VKAKHWPPTKTAEEEVLHLLRQLSPEELRDFSKKFNASIVRELSKISKTPEELMQWRDKMLAPSLFPTASKCSRIAGRPEKTIS